MAAFFRIGEMKKPDTGGAKPPTHLFCGKSVIFLVKGDVSPLAKYIGKPDVFC
jgi:hypothetical protein